MKTMLTRILLLIIILSMSVLLTACGGDPTSTPGQSSTNNDATSSQAEISAALATATMLTGSIPEENPSSSALDLTKIDPCTLLTNDEVTTLMGDVPVAPRPMTQGPDHTACSYVEPSLEVNSPRLFLSLEPPDLWDYHTKDVVNLSGVGDQAESADFDGWSTIYVLVKNKAVLSLDIYPKDTEIAKQLAQKAIDRLP